MFLQNDHTLLPDAPRSGRYLLPFLGALLFALTILPATANAQIIGDIEANITFQFHVGDAKLPPGKYIVRMLDDSDLSVMEILSLDGSTSALFQVEPVQANSAPGKTELIFNKYGKRYFLAKLFDEGNPYGSRIVPSRYEKRIAQEVATEERLPANHRKRQAN